MKKALTELFVQGDLTALDRYWSDHDIQHNPMIGNGHDALIAVDIFRIQDGKLAEHWDVLQEEVPAAMAASKNPMFPVQ